MKQKLSVSIDKRLVEMLETRTKKCMYRDPSFYVEEALRKHMEELD